MLHPVGFHEFRWCRYSWHHQMHKLGAVAGGLRGRGSDCVLVVFGAALLLVFCGALQLWLPACGLSEAMLLAPSTPML